MITNINNIPTELKSLIQSESPDFILESSRDKPIIKALLIIGLAIITAIGFITAIIFNADDFSLILLGIFTAITFFYGIDCLFKEGYIFVSTSNKLICYKKEKIEFRNWHEFANPTILKHNGSDGSISLEIKEEYLPEYMQYRKFGYDNTIFNYLSDKIFILDIPNVLEVQNICRQRIIENDLKKDYKKYKDLLIM